MRRRRGAFPGFGIISVASLLTAAPCTNCWHGGHHRHPLIISFLSTQFDPRFAIHTLRGASAARTSRR
uniref:Putative secreted peptide n=1 Tax=Anopheles braziliensis TaxID=58242 RepID=A0A2M3ZXA7_9DIPT